MAAILLVLLLQAGYLGIQEKLPLAVAPQPVAFRHKQHAAAGAKCADCHTTVLTAERAGIPQTAQCKLCHPAMQLPPKIPWVRVYKLPDFVFFSHAAHAGAAGIGCETCHGPVASRDVLQKEVSTSMRNCVECHRARQVSIDCSRCHELGQ
jgi:hypothetical protein